MSKNYDNWDKLVGAVMKREEFRQMALSDSLSSISSFSDESSSSSFNSAILTGDDATDDGCSWKRSLPGVVFMPVEARGFSIRTEDYPKLAYSFISFKFAEAAKVKPSLSIDIRGMISTRLLTSNTIYEAYLLFKGGGGGFEAKTMITFVNDETYVDGERQGTKVQLVNEGGEVALGSFYVGEGYKGEVEARLVVVTSNWKECIVVEGIEFRPLVNVKQLDSTFN